MVTKNEIIKTVEDNASTLLSDDCVHISKIEIRQQKRLGFHVAVTQRFICLVRAVAKSGKETRYDIFVKKGSNADAEYRKMVTLWSEHYFKQDKYLIPRPLFVDSQRSLLFTDYFVGENLVNLFYRRLLLRRDAAAFLDETVASAARWLADFQSIHRSAHRIPVPSEMLGYETNVGNLRMLGDGDRKRIVGKANSAIRNCPRYPQTYVHGEYLPRNIIFRGEQICVVDFPDYRIGWPLYDVLRFLVGIDRLVQYPFISRSFCELAKARFVSEYIAQSHIEHEARTLENLWAPFVLTYVRRMYPRHKDIRGALNDQFVSQVLRRLVSWSKAQ